MKPIIRSLLDNDLYKFTMLQAFRHYEKNTDSVYEFCCRTPHVDFKSIINDLKLQIGFLCDLKFNDDELDYLSGLPYFKSEFINYLKHYRLKKENVSFSVGIDGKLKLIIRGPVTDASLFEVYLMSIINQLYFNSKIDKRQIAEKGTFNLDKKIETLKEYEGLVNFTDFGTRRRLSFEWHENVVRRIIKSGYSGFCGTSNVYFARKYGLKPVGTMAHEWIMSHTGNFSLEESTSVALKRWLEFYHGELGIALTDTYTTNYFLKVFDRELSNAFNGVRHDSGHWKDWGYKMIDHYEKFGIDFSRKSFVFSDGLDFDTVLEIYKEFSGKVNLLFGIGTNLTNDVGVKPIQIVIKMVECNGKPVIKISDTPGKIICRDKEFKRYAFEKLLV